MSIVTMALLCLLLPAACDSRSGKPAKSPLDDISAPLTNLGDCLEKAGRPREALKKYKRALTLVEPGDPLAREIRLRMDRLSR